MRIGIYTLPLNYNYGGLLQAYALQTVLERMGNDVTVIDRPYVHNVNILSHPREFVRRFKIKYINGNRRTRIFEEKYEAKVYSIIEKNTRCFVEKYIHTVFVDDASEIKDGMFDAIIVGSDQIWRAGIQKRIECYHSFLDFTENWKIKRIAYAPSFGTENWEYDKRDEYKCKNLLKKFDAVSCREQSGAVLCQEHFGIEAKVVMDPTMLLTLDDYLSLIKDSIDKPCDEKIMVYVLDETIKKMELIKRVSKNLGLDYYKINSKADDIYAPVNERVQPPLQNWLQGFRDSQMIITDSFHACVFSILFGKPFLVIGNQNRGMARFYSLLEMFGLEDRLVDDGFNGPMPCSSIDKAQEKLISFRNDSLNWIRVALDSIN